MKVQRKYSKSSPALVRDRNGNSLLSGNPALFPLNTKGGGINYDFGEMPVYAQQQVQPKLQVNQPLDAAEKQADLMAEKVVQQPAGNTAFQPLVMGSENGTIVNQDLSGTASREHDFAAQEAYDHSKEVSLFNTIEKGSANNSNDTPYINNIAALQSRYQFGLISVYPKVVHTAQPKLTINTAGDVYEQEADAISEKVIMMQGKADAPVSVSPVSMVQRKCPLCGSENHEGAQEKDEESDYSQQMPVQRKCAKCEEEEKKKLQRKESSTHQPLTTATVTQILQSPGRPLEGAVRAYMEPRLGFNFSSVRIHDDAQANQSASDIHALAYTHQQNIVFGAGQYQPQTQAGKRLLAHELVHVIQQGDADTIRRQESDTAEPQQGRFIVEDNAIPAEGQMRKTAFLERLNEEICRTVDEGLRGSAYSSDNCPYIRAAFARQRNLSPQQIEQLLLRYAPGAAGAQSAQDLIQMILPRVLQAVITWKQTGRITGVPEGLTAELSGGTGATNNNPSTDNPAAKSVQFKSDGGEAKASGTPGSILQNLGRGSRLDGTTRSRMENAFGTSFSDVQIHNDNQSSGLSGSMNARAFTVGNHIAFGQGEYKPGTLRGDALLAHELAHVVQQQNGEAVTNQSVNGTGYQSLESDADMSAMQAMLSVWTAMKAGVKNLPKKAMPRLRSGLRLQRCVAAAVPAAAGAAGVSIGLADILGALGIATLITQVESDSPRPMESSSSSSTSGTATTAAPTTATTSSTASTATTAAATAVAATVAQCEAMHQAYKALGNCKSCERTDTAAIRAAKIACLTAVIAGRRLYLTARCDYILPGSIARGSAVAERGHLIQVQQLENMLAKCSTLPTI